MIYGRGWIESEGEMKSLNQGIIVINLFRDHQEEEVDIH